VLLWTYFGESFSLDLFDLGRAMESSSNYSRIASSFDAKFAFNDSNSSESLLRIEIMIDLIDESPSFEGCTTILDWDRYCKRKV